MNLLLSSLLLLPLLGLAFADDGLEIQREWDKGYQAKFRVHVDKATNGWELRLKFANNLERVEAYNAKVAGVSGSNVVLKNEHWNANLKAGSDLVVYFGVRYPAGRAKGSTMIKWAGFNGKSVDVGSGSASSESDSQEKADSGSSSSSQSSEE